MSIFLPETDSEDELPGGWEERSTAAGDVYYANHNTKCTQWTHPRTGRRKRVSGSMPFGWERVVGQDGKVVFVHHHTRRTTYTDPRLAFAVEVKGEEENTKKNVRFRQRFDASSNAMAVLHGMDLSGKVAVVTGAGRGGVGYETARTFAFHGCTVVLACRRLIDGQEAVESIKAERPHAECLAIYLDLKSFRSVRQFASDFLSRFQTLDVLVLNAGVFGLEFRLTDEDQLDETFQVNYLSQVYLASLLKGAMSKTLKPRLVSVSAESHRFSDLTYESLCGPSALARTSAAGHNHLSAYNDSKLLLLMFSLEADLRWRRHGVRSYTVHPGNCVPSRLPRHSLLYRALFALVRPFAKSLQQAASSAAFAAFSPDVEDLGEGDPRYLNNCFPCAPSPAAAEERARARAWEMTEGILREKVDGFSEL